MPSAQVFLAVGAGGAIGAMLRLALSAAVTALAPAAFPFGILAVNLLGCFCMGLLAGLWWLGGESLWRSFLATGVLGGFTTFSAFSLDALLLLEKRETLLALGYIAASTVGCVAAAAAGLACMRALAPGP